ncbi:alpha-1,2-mannosidase [Kitasatospora sp. NE20-6]|uniref:GH92 family glycosyl hydrolase n=1 Tax=Kitasatospora sp. NE20-6 TaxID=2859066 RepID=UPI0034DBB9CA
MRSLPTRHLNPARFRRVLALAAVTALLAAFTAVTSADRAVAADRSAFDSVDQFIGTQNDAAQNKGNSAYGNTWPGATLPFGMVQFTPTTYNSKGTGNWGGYEYDADRLRGFGLTRLSGTGCAGANGAFDIPVLPYTGAPTPGGGLPVSPADRITDYYPGFSHTGEQARPGYYSVALGNGVGVSLTATTRTGVASFTFPQGGASSMLLFDVAGSNNGSTANAVTVQGSTVSGWTQTRTVCNGGSYRIHFSATFDTAPTGSGTWSGSTVTPGGTSATSATAHGAGAFVRFPVGSTVTARIGISYVSTDGAARNAATETAGRSFAELRAQAASVWTSALHTAEVTGGTTAARTVFCTALYHALLHPNTYEDTDGRYLGFDGTVRQVRPGHHEYATYSSWDTSRGQAQLVALLLPKVASDINQSITDLATQTGRWPNWPHNGVSQQKMSGDGLQVVLSSADAFGSTDYDRRAALASMAATQTLPATATNRPYLLQYAGLGWAENRNGDNATSKTLEYAVDDFAIARLADRLGDPATRAAFMARAQNWQNLLDPVTGEIRPRSRSGFDRAFDLTTRGDQFEQSTGIQYGWMVPHNTAALIARRGGTAAATAALDTFFTALDAGVYNTPYAYLSNEADLQTPWIYNWLRQPARATDVLRRTADQLYTTAPTGLPGNDDLGGLSAWYVWAATGLFPSIPGTAELSVSAPMFAHIEIHPADTARSIVIDAPGIGPTAPYIRTMAVDGTATTASWLPESFARTGGRITYTTAATPGTWGTGPDDAPPSYGEGTDAYNGTGTTEDGAGNTGTLDATGHSLPRSDLRAAGATPGATLRLGTTGVEFTWPGAAPGQADHWVPHGQAVAMGSVAARSIAFLGLATNGPAQGTATVLYTDGTAVDVPVGLTDWTPGTTYRFGNVPLLTTTGRNLADGTRDTTAAKVLATAPVALDPAKRVATVLLPKGTDQGVMHIFAVGLAR